MELGQLNFKINILVFVTECFLKKVSHWFAFHDVTARCVAFAVILHQGGTKIVGCTLHSVRPSVRPAADPEVTVSGSLSRAPNARARAPSENPVTVVPVTLDEIFCGLLSVR